MHTFLCVSVEMGFKFHSNWVNHFHGIIWLETDSFNECVSYLFYIVRLNLSRKILNANYLLRRRLKAIVYFPMFFYDVPISKAKILSTS